MGAAATAVMAMGCGDADSTQEPDEPLDAVQEAVYAVTVAAPAVPIELGQPVTASWTAGVEHSPNDWIGLFKVGASDNSYLSYKYVGSQGLTSGTLTLTVPLTASLDPGPYELRYFYAGQYTNAAKSNSFAGYANYVLTADPGSIELGQLATVTWQAPLAHSQYDWIALFKVGAPDSPNLGWTYVGFQGAPSGTLTLKVPLTSSLDPGPYEVRYFVTGRSASVTKSNSLVGYANYSVAPQGPCVVGSALPVSWTAPLAHATSDSIHLFKVGTPYVYGWQYVGSPALAAGTVNISIGNPGTYELRYFVYGSNSSIAISDPFACQQ